MVLIVVGVFFILYWSYSQLYNPLIVKTRNLINENNELMVMSLMAEKAGTIKEDNEDKVDNHRLAFAKFNEKIPEKSYLPETIKFIEELGKENNIDLLLAQYVLSEDLLISNAGGDCQECLFEIDVRGSYLNLTKFIRGIENATRLYNIESITMNMDSVTEINEELMEEILVYNSPAITMKVIFKSYYDNISWGGIEG